MSGDILNTNCKLYLLPASLKKVLFFQVVVSITSVQAHRNIYQGDLDKDTFLLLMVVHLSRSHRTQVTDT